MESERLYFRAPELSDVEILGKWINDPRIRMYLDHRVFPVSSTAEADWIRSSTSLAAAPSELAFVFGRRGKNAIIGTTGFREIHWVQREAEWGILIGEPADWDRGFGREIARRMLKYAFTSLNLNRVSLRVSADNTRALHSYQGAGFVQEGVLRSAGFRDGKYDDLIIMSALRDEWLERQPEPEPAQPSGGKKPKTARKSAKRVARR